MYPLVYRCSATYITLADDIRNLSVAIFCSYIVVNGKGRYLFLIFLVLFNTFPFIFPFILS